MELTQGETWASNILNSTVKEVEGELNRAKDARDAYMALLATKYNAVYNAETGELKPK